MALQVDDRQTERPLLEGHLERLAPAPRCRPFAGSRGARRPSASACSSAATSRSPLKRIARAPFCVGAPGSHWSRNHIRCCEKDRGAGPPSPRGEIDVAAARRRSVSRRSARLSGVIESRRAGSVTSEAGIPTPALTRSACKDDPLPPTYSMLIALFPGAYATLVQRLTDRLPQRAGVAVVDSRGDAEPAQKRAFRGVP